MAQMAQLLGRTPRIGAWEAICGGFGGLEPLGV